ncbi:PTS transporter subunit IIC [uncultured Clostridium sp.]|jgi:PTS system galactitol-specific IIC component|uniref:PTS galactitol transporter subunit IIC n=1 Tax=uncultured Clostridium sp. TaxID=59620 RepID=UPI00261A6DD0|nr:PTS transporter subunit IIC [uncultured Clostridium sp.]
MILTDIKDFFTVFGAPVFLPIVIFIICKALRMSVKKSFLSGLYAGVGLQGFMLLIGAFTPIIMPVVKQMVTSTGINLPVLDLGWQTTAIIGYSSKIGLIFFAFAIIIQLVLFATRFTNIFLPSDLWLNYTYMVWGAMVYIATKSFGLAMLFMVVILLYSILNFEVICRSWSRYYKYPNCTIISTHNTEPTVLLYILDPLFNKFGLNKLKFHPEHMKEKMGIFGEPGTIGLFLGILIGILGNIKRLDTMVAWGQIMKLGVVLAALLIIFPKISEIFAKAFLPMAEVVEKRLNTSETKGREWYIGVDDATGYGEPATLITGTILIPIIIFMALILPGNKTLPMVDLVALPFMVEAVIAMTKGNVLKTTIVCGIWYSAGLYMCTAIAPIYTQAAVAAGIAIPAGALMITSFNMMAQPIAGLMFLGFITKNPFIIGFIIVLYFVLLFVVKKHKVRIHNYIEKMAEKNA